MKDPVKDKKEASRRVIRGGAWIDFARRTRVSNRGSGSPSSRGFNLGFRLARTIKE